MNDIKPYLVTVKSKAGPDRLMIRREFFDKYYKPGVNARWLARIWNVNNTLIYKSLERLGIPVKTIRKKALPEAEIVKGYKKGLSIDQLRIKYHSHNTRIKEILLKSGIKIRKQWKQPSSVQEELIRRKMSEIKNPEQVGKSMGLSKYVVQRIYERTRYDPIIKEMYYSIKPWYYIEQIAKKIGKNEIYVDRRIRAMKLFKTNDPQHPRNLFYNTKIRELYTVNRLSIEQIAKKIGIHDETVRKRLHLMKIPIRTVAGLDEEFVKKRDAQIKKMYEAGVPWDEIYSKLNIARVGKPGQLRRIGITLNRQMKRYLPKGIYDQAIKMIFKEKINMAEAARRLKIFHKNDPKLGPETSGIKYHMIKKGLLRRYHLMRLKETGNAPTRALADFSWELNLKILEGLKKGYNPHKISLFVNATRQAVVDRIDTYHLLSFKEPEKPEGITKEEELKIRRRVETFSKEI